MAQYGDLVLGQKGTVFNPLAGVAYSTPDQLALDLGTTADKIQWNQIRKDPNYTLPTSNAISLDKMKPVPDLQANLPTPTPKTDPSGATVASATQTSKSLQDYIKEITPVESETSKTEKSIVSDLLKLAPELGGKKAALAEAETATGVPELQKQLAALNSQILTGVAELNQYDTDLQKSLLDLEGKPQQLSSVVGTQQAFVQRQAAALKAAKASEVQLLQARAQGLAGETEAARNSAARAVDLRYENLQDEYNLKLQQLELIQPLLNKEEKIQAEALQRKYEDEQVVLAKEKEQTKNNIDLALGAGITSKYTNFGGTIVNTFTGQSFSTPEELFKDAGVSSWEQLNATNQITNYTDAVNKQVMASKKSSSGGGSGTATNTSPVSVADRDRYNLPITVNKGTLEKVKTAIQTVVGQIGQITNENRYELWDAVASAIKDAGLNPSDYDAILWEAFHPEGLTGYQKYVLGKGQPKQTTQTSTQSNSIINPF